MEEKYYVIVKFIDKRANSDYNFVGKVLREEENGEVSVKYFRCYYSVSGGDFSCFKEPQNEDIYHNEVTVIVKSRLSPTLLKKKFDLRLQK